MIAHFLESWSLFHNSYLAGWSIACLLSLVGVLVVARDQIFIGAAISQASTLGIALGMVVSNRYVSAADHHAEGEGLPTLLAVAFSVLAAVLTTRGGRAQRESHEAITGWVFLLASSLAILIVSGSPLGMEEIQRLLASSIIGATAHDVAVFAALAVVTAVGLGVFRRAVLLLAIDPAMAEAVGLRVTLWNFALAAWLGLVIGLAIHSAGMLFTFGCLVLPALIAKNVCRNMAPLFLVSPVVALLTSVAAFVLANEFDFPPAQMTVALMGLLLALAWSLRPRG